MSEQTVALVPTDTAVVETAELPANHTFNLIIASSIEEVRTLARRHGLSNLHFLSDVERQGRLPTSGPARGAALDRFLGERNEATLTLAIIQADSWVSALLNPNSTLSRSVWRSIESSLMGHRTNQRRNMVVVGSGCMYFERLEAEAKGQLIVVEGGQPLPTHWRPERSRTEKPAKTLSTSTKKTMENHPKRRKEERMKRTGNTKSVEKRPGIKKPLVGGVKGFQEARKKRGGRAGNGNPALNDLYLLCKGHYGPVGEASRLLTWTKETLRFHAQTIDGPRRSEFTPIETLQHSHKTGLGTHDVSDEDAIKQLFHTLVAHSTRAHWGGFSLLQELVSSAARGTQETAQTLAGWIATIPARDTDGQEIVQPQVNVDLAKYLESHSRTISSAQSPT